MIFTEFRFLGFFLVVFAVHWALRSHFWRKAWLLLASYVFYAAWDWRFLGLILISTLVAYLTGLALADEERPRRRRAWLWINIVSNLGILGTFKYFDFFVDAALPALRWLGIPASQPSLQIVLPVGVSFYTFQAMSYAIDVYQRKLATTRNAVDLALFIAFFPQLVAGPIVRALDFLPQLQRRTRAANVRYQAALLLFLSGFFKKAVVSDNIAPIVDSYFTAPEQFTAASAWVGVPLFATQIYCDFSGYSDMAIACAALLGYNLRINFDFPYLAADISQFWRRWHMSLSSWLRDYLFIPLGGSRGSRWFSYRNLMLTMLLGGLWHGAAWRFVFWGGLHGLALVVHRLVRESTGRPLMPAPVGAILTFWWVCLGWIFFRAEDLPTAFAVVRSYVLFQSPGSATLPGVIPLTLVGLAIVHVISWHYSPGRAIAGWPGWLFAPAYGLAAALTLAFARPDAAPFIYFQF